MKLSVVIPAYNEQENIRACIQEVYDRFPKAEIIVVNDASTDRTADILRTITIPNLKVINNERNMGHGFAVQRGLNAAQGRYILYIDADRQISLDNYVERSAHIVSGWRTHRHDKLFRKCVSFMLKMTILFRFGYYVKDANCPFKIYRSEYIKPLLHDLPDTDTVPIACLEIIARKNGLHVETIKTPHAPYNGVRGGFLQSINPKSLNFIWEAFKEIVKL